MTIQRLPLLTSVDPEFSGNGEVLKGSLSKNAMYSKYSDGRVYVTQRPAINIRSQASVSSIPAKARGIIYWDAASVYVVVVNDKVYIGDYSTTTSTDITAGRDPVTLLEMGDYLVILDTQNDQGWYILSSSPTTLLSISDSDFPSNLSNSILAGGGAVLDGFVFVASKSGTIYNSNLDDPTTWDALDFIESSREEDSGLYITKHHDHIVSIGTKSIEFYYNAGNPAASPLQRRSDISYQTGAIDAKSVFNTGNVIYFVGSDRTGTIGVYKIEQFKLEKVSTDAIDTYLAVTRTRSKYDFIVSGVTVGDHPLMFITAVSPGSGTWDPQYTLVYDGASGTFVQYETDIASVGAFSVVGATERSASDARESTILFLSGDFGSFDLTFARLDSAGTSSYVDADYIVLQDDYIIDLGQDLTANFEMILLFPETDFQSVTNKFLHRLSVVGTTTAPATDSEPLYVSWTDDHYRTFSSERELSTGLNRSLTRCGKFRRRAFNLRYEGTDILRLEGLELDVRASSYA
jgi:hypothetical protein